MMTGASPLRHGILDFVQLNPRTGAQEPITSERAPRARHLEHGDLRAASASAVLGLWATYPAETVNGLVVSDRLFSFLSGRARRRRRRVAGGARAWAGRRWTTAEADRVRRLHAYLPSLTNAEYQQHAESDDPYGASGQRAAPHPDRDAGLR